ncbi:Hsp33 family molecular chaperone HslO [Thalassotalea ponticola]|uniref:Hsp33 family molecular chaperone HslO n=1 Tax=Thalassotalea ponticola TaxID=1523392 RepID=UPI0025B40C34|nr:Hsp33 family molecular chaperone HslO [Thalassotalea ponticola]MDN3652992.1 Hsp33 family molecular chaperone HslO [Thalassotalea ponticola]
MQTDVLNRFLFEDLHARGELVQLDQSFKQIVENHNYPDAVKQLLGELMAATCLLTATLKFEGEIAVQIQGDGPVQYMVINGDHQQRMRGTANINGQITGTSLNDLMGNANMVITVMPKNGERYQGIVRLEGDSLAECIEHYFATSEQLATRIWLYADSSEMLAAGALVQVLPDSEDKDQQMLDFEHICQLTATLKASEIFQLPAEEVLYRLYHEQTVRVFDPQSVTFVCGCSEDKCLTAIANIGQTAIEEHLAEHGEIKINCEFCLKQYHFDREKLKPLLKPN